MVITLKVDSAIKKNGSQSIYYKVSHGKSGSIGQIRKRVYTGIGVSVKQFDVKNFRAKSKHPNQQIINVKIDELRSIKSLCETKFEAGHYTIEQVINHLSGKADVESVDSYIETIVKEQKKNVTYKDYQSTLRAFKKHLGIDRPVTFNEFTNYSLLLKFKNNALKTLRPTSINSYFKKITAINNDAYKNSVIYNKFELYNGLKVTNASPLEIKTCTYEEFAEAINNATTIYNLQALGCWLLMFATRGMYQADIVKFKSFKLSNSSLEDIPDEILKIIENPKRDKGLDIYRKIMHDGYDYIVHTRSKNENRTNIKMYIRIEKELMNLFILLKLLVTHTHRNRVSVIGNADDFLSIFDYDVNDTKLHNSVWDVCEKNVKRVLGYSFKNARKTFNSYAQRLRISSEIRRVLLGHKDASMLQYYDDKDAVFNEVNSAHMDVLYEFRTYELIDMLKKKTEAFAVDEKGARIQLKWFNTKSLDIL